MAKETLEKIGSNGWKCVTSTFTVMELIDIEKEYLYFQKKIEEKWEIHKILRERRDKDLTLKELKPAGKLIESFFKDYPFIEQHDIYDKGSWEKAQEISLETNLSAADVMHLVTAGQSKSDLLITADQQFSKEAQKFLRRKNESRPIFINTDWRAITNVVKRVFPTENLDNTLESVQL